MRHLILTWYYFFSQCEILMLLALTFDCYFGIGFVSMIYLACKLYHPHGYKFVTVFVAIVFKMVGYEFLGAQATLGASNSLILQGYEGD